MQVTQKKSAVIKIILQCPFVLAKVARIPTAEQVRADFLIAQNEEMHKVTSVLKATSAQRGP